jgi:glutamate-1-semialdehyde 2,1-aminomutase
VIPGGVYGHLKTSGLDPSLPQFFERGDGSQVWDVDGKQYTDLMCSFGPMIVGHGNPIVRRAAQQQAELGDTLSGPTKRMVELAELFVETVPSADWAMFSKNGTDATTMAVTTARAATGKRVILVARGSYHGAAPWCTPNPLGVVAEDRAFLKYFEYNDLPSAERAAAEAGGDLAGIIVTPIRHDMKHDVELPDSAFARGLRALATRASAALILDDVRCGFRLNVQGSWENLGVRPDMVAWSKAIANGFPLGALTGVSSLKEAASSIFVTGSFWYSAVSMAASIATITLLREHNGPEQMRLTGSRLRSGLLERSSANGFAIRHTGPVQMPVLSFDDDPNFEKVLHWTVQMAERGVIVHPWHNWFLSTAHTIEDIDRVIAASDYAFASMRGKFDA